MRKYLRVVGAGLATVALAAGVAACGSGGETGSTSGGTSGATEATESTADVSGPAFKLGAICSCSGAQAAALGDLGKVSEAWAESVNANGGINGHPVEMTVYDDGGDPATALKQVKQLVEEDKVQAIVGNDSLQDVAWAEYVAKKGVPVIGGLTSSIPFLTNPDFFASGAGIPVMIVGMEAIAKEQGMKKFGIMYCAETPVCAQVVPLGELAAQLNGLEFTSAKVSATQPSYAAQCLQFKEEGVEAISISHNADVIQRIVEACHQQGFEPALIAEGPTAAGSWLDVPVFNESFFSAPNANYADTSVPAVAEFHEGLEEFAPDVLDGSFSYTTINPWISGKYFQEAAETGNLSPSSTPAQVTAAMPKLNGTEIDGLAPPLVITKGQPVFTPCYFKFQLKDGEFVSLDEGKTSCLSEEETETLVTTLAKAFG
jgi:branched-chain amino acid transport system substrate-binding protein